MVTTEEFHELPQYDLREDVIKLLPYEFCMENYVVVLEPFDPETGSGAVIGMLHPDDEDLVEEIADKLGYDVNPVQLNGHEINRAIETGYNVEELTHYDVPSLVVHHNREISFDPDQDPGKILSDLFSEAIRRQASDVHIENYKNDVDLRFRIDGVLDQITTPLSPQNIRRVISKLKVMAELDITEQRRDQDGRMTILYVDEDGGERNIDVRLSVVPGPHGEEAVMRILDSEQYILNLERLGFHTDQLNRYRDLIGSPGGMILSVGPTGSGKTTTLYSSIRQVSDAQNKVLTVEDPIEYEFDKVNQKQVSSHMGFSDHTRAFLRQDPDVILVGEIRDERTAQIAVRAANTGHLVFSTLHTGNAIMSVSRLRSLGVDDDYLADVLLGVVSQRLIRLICDHCKVETEPDSLLVDKFYSQSPDHTFWTGEGCEQCDQTGYQGRTGVFEILTVDENIQDRIARGVPAEVIRKDVRDRGSNALHKNALEKVQQGMTSLEEVSRVVMPPVTLRSVSA